VETVGRPIVSPPEQPLQIAVGGRADYNHLPHRPWPRRTAP